MQTKQPDAARPVRAMIDAVENIPPQKFGKSSARYLRKLIVVTIAKFADADGTNARPSVETLARLCLCSERTIYRVVRYLQKNRVIAVEHKATRVRGNRYTILFTQMKPAKSRVTKLRHGDTGVRMSEKREVPDSSQNQPDNSARVPDSLAIVPDRAASSDRPVDRPIRPSVYTVQTVQQNRSDDGHADDFEESTTSLARMFRNIAGVEFTADSEDRAGIRELVEEFGYWPLAYAVEEFARDGHNWKAVRSPARLFLSRTNDYLYSGFVRELQARAA